MSASQKFETLRKQLFSSGYREFFSLDSLPLVQHLYNDMKNFQKELEVKTKDFNDMIQKGVKDDIETITIREENFQLQKQISILRMENIKHQEHIEKLEKDLENKVSKTQGEVENLSFLVEELKRRTLELERESSSKSEKIHQLLETKKRGPSSLSDKGGKVSESEKEFFIISSPLEPKAMTSHNVCSACGCEASKRSKSKDTYLADLLKMTDKKLMILQGEIETHKQNYSHAQKQIQELERKVHRRETEIERLESLLESCRFVEDNKYMSAHNQLHEQSRKIEHLTKINKELETKLNSMVGDTHEAMSQAMKMVDVTKDLENELQTVATSTRLLKKDCLSATENLSIQLARNKEKLKNCTDDLIDQHSRFHSIKDDRDRLEMELTRLTHSHSQLEQEMEKLIEINNDLKAELANLQEMVAIGQGERKTMADRINSLTAQLQKCEGQKQLRENEILSLNSNISSLEERVKEYDALQEQLKSEIESLIEQKSDVELEKRNLNSENLKLRNEKERLEGHVMLQEKNIKELKEDNSAVKQERDYYNEDVNNLQALVSELKMSDQKLRQKVEETKHALDAMENEKDQYNEQVTQLLDILKVKPSTMAAAQISKSKLKPEEELGKVLYERDVVIQERNFYKTQLQKFKRNGTVIPSSTVVDAKSPPLSDTEKEQAKTFDDGRQISSSDIENIEMVRTLKAEREFLKSQMEHYQQLYNESKMRTRMSPVVLSPSEVSPPISREKVVIKEPERLEEPLLGYKIQAVEKEKAFFQEQYDRLKASISKTFEDLPSMDTDDIANIIREKNALREERDFYQHQYVDLSAKISQALPVEGPSKIQTAMKKDLDFTLAEKRSFALAKSQLETQVIHLKSDIEDLEQENLKLRSSNKELSKAVENFQNAAMQNFPPSMQDFIKEIRKSRDLALKDVEKIKEERDELKMKLKTLYSQQMRERSSAEEDFSALQIQKNESEASAAELRERLQSQSNLVASLQEQIQTLQSALDLTQNELGLSTRNMDQIKKHLKEKSGLADTTGLQLISISNQLSDTKSRAASLQDEVSRLQEENGKLKAEVTKYKQNLNRLDTDKDHLTSELDNRAEMIEGLKAELKKRNAQVVSLETEGAKKDANIRSCEMAIEIQQKKLAEEEKRNDGLQQDLALAIEQRDTANKEIRRLQKDVISLSQDMKKLESELQKTRICRDNFKRKCQEYCRTLESLSITITKKDKAQDTLAQQYLSLAETLNSLQMLNSTLKGEEAAAAAAEHKQSNRIDEMVKNFREERDQLMAQVNEVLSKNEELETQCHRLETEKYKLEESLLGAKDATQKEESKRNEAECEAKRLSILLDKVLDEKRSLQHQIESLSSQLQSEQRALQSVEEILSEKRKKEFTSDSMIQELQVERAQLQRKISELTSDLEHELEEVKRLRNHSASLELEKDRLKQQLSMEQYDRERMSQELRRVRKYSQMEEALSSGDNGGPRPPLLSAESHYKPYANGSPTSHRSISRSPTLFASKVSAQIDSSLERSKASLHSTPKRTLFQEKLKEDIYVSLPPEASERPAYSSSPAAKGGVSPFRATSSDSLNGSSSNSSPSNKPHKTFYASLGSLTRSVTSQERPNGKLL